MYNTSFILICRQYTIIQAQMYKRVISFTRSSDFAGECIRSVSSVIFLPRKLQKLKCGLIRLVSRVVERILGLGKCHYITNMRKISRIMFVHSVHRHGVARADLIFADRALTGQCRAPWTEQGTERARTGQGTMDRAPRRYIIIE